MAFSGALTLTDLNDYLGPSQACIKPVSGKDAPSELDDAKESGGLASTEIAIDADGEYYESKAQVHLPDRDVKEDKGPRARTRLETAEISLNDCLACSGCVTSAETVLIGMQSVEELRKVIASKSTMHAPDSSLDTAPTFLVASVSPQSLASLSAKYSTSLAQPILLQDILRRIEHFLTSQMQFDVVVDTSFARYVALAEQAREFRERRQADQHGSGSSAPNLPMLASACPGWICYAEKTHGELIPLISKTRSPQQIAGLIAKRYVTSNYTNMAAAGGARVYHVTVMPCYDKKLEASRQDFFDDVTQTRDVDLVITTGELDDLMHAEGFDILAPLNDAATSDLISTPPGSDNGFTMHGVRHARLPVLLDQPGSSSGSYLFDLMKRVWMEHVEEAGKDQAELPSMRVKTIRSADYTEYVLRTSDGSGRILFKGAQCYGFRNLQNLVRKVQRQTGLKSKKAAAAALLDGPSTLSSLGMRSGMALRGRGRGGFAKRGRVSGVGGSTANEGSPLGPQSGSTMTADRVREEDEESRGYDFVEVMACPGGCVNGGGQIRPPGQANETSAGASSALTTRSITTDVTEAILDGVPPTNADDAHNLETRINKPITKSLDPEGYAHGWATPPLSVASSDGGDAMDSGMSTPQTEEPVQGWKGTTKAWVKRVEYIYWAALAHSGQVESDSEHARSATPASIVANVHQAQAQGVSRDDISQTVAHALKLASVAARASTSSVELDHLVDDVVATMCQGERLSSVKNEEARASLLRTQYRALQDEAVSGLAVQW